MFPTDGDYHSSNFEENISFDQIFNTSLKFLSKSGLAFFIVSLEFITIHAKRIQERLKSNGLYISAVFEPGKLFGDAHFSLDFSSEGDRVFEGLLPRTLIIAIRRKPVEFIFAAQFCSNNQILELAKNYKSLQSNKQKHKKQDNLCKGIMLEEDVPFYNFNRHRNLIKIENLAFEYKSYDAKKAKKLSDITIDIYFLMRPSNITQDILSFDEFNNYLFGPPTSVSAKSREKRKKQLSNSLFICENRRKVTDVLSHKSFLKYYSQFSDRDLDQADSTIPFFFQIVVNEKIIDKEFLAIYLSDGIGKLTLDSIAKYEGTSSYTSFDADMNINQTDLENIYVAIPDMKTQKSLVKAIKKITELGRNVSQFKTNLSLMPSHYKEINDKADEMNNIFHNFSEDEKLNSLISGEETGKVEFKASFRYSDWSKKKSDSNQESALKAICSFLNRDGGTLIIGVSERDKKFPRTVNGIDEEIENLNNNSKEQFIQYFCRTIENKLSMGREECWEFITYKSHKYKNGKSIFIIDCEFNDKGSVKIEGKDDELHVRGYAQVNTYRGNEMKNYEREHWKK